MDKTISPEPIRFCQRDESQWMNMAARATPVWRVVVSSQESEGGLGRVPRSHLLHGSSSSIQAPDFIFQTFPPHPVRLPFLDQLSLPLIFHFFISANLPTSSQLPCHHSISSQHHILPWSTATVPKLYAEALQGTTVNSEGHLRLFYIVMGITAMSVRNY